MAAKPFLDTTVLIYAVSEGDPKAAIAEALLATGGRISVQVLNEFAAVAHRKLKMSWKEIGEALGALRNLCEPPAPLTVPIHESGLALAARYRLNLYDALIVSAAIDAGCTLLYSEDMQHNQKIGPLTIRNPFLKG